MDKGSGALPNRAAMQALVTDGEFEETLLALESVVEYLERGGLSIDESVSWYEIGLGLTRRCSDLLHQAELRISVIEDRYAAMTDLKGCDDNAS